MNDLLSGLPGYLKVCRLSKRIVIQTGRPPVKILLRILLTLLFVLLVNKGISGADLYALAGNLHPVLLVSAVFLGALSFYLQLLRWQVILTVHGLPSDSVTALRTMFRGNFLGFVTPGRMGELFRAVHIAPDRKAAGITATVEERFCAVVVTVGGGVCGMLAQRTIWGGPFFWPLVTSSVLFAAGMVIIAAVAAGKLHNLTGRSGWIGKISSVTGALVRFRSFPLGRLTLLSVGVHLLLLLQTALLFIMFGNYPLPVMITVAAQAYSFMLLLPFFIANIGSREYSFSLFLSRMVDFQAETLSPGIVALGVATIILIINIILPAAIGLFWVYSEKKVEHRIGNKGKHGDAT